MPKISAKKEITLDDLAAMCMREFTFMRETMATKQDIAEVRSEMADMKSEVSEIVMDIADIRSKMATKEDIAGIKLLIADHMFRIQRLEQTAEAD